MRVMRCLSPSVSEDLIILLMIADFKDYDIRVLLVTGDVVQHSPEPRQLSPPQIRQMG
jgi:hypothetical protein